MDHKQLFFSRSDVQIVTPFDEAIDFTASNLNGYILTRDISYLKFLPGAKPTVYHVRRIPHSRALSISAGSEHLRNSIAFMTGVVKIENYFHSSGSMLSSWIPKWKQEPDRPESMTDEELNDMTFHPDDIEDVGGVALARCFLRPKNAVLFDLPHSLRVALVKRERASRLVEVLSTLSERSEEPSPPSNP